MNEYDRRNIEMSHPDLFRNTVEFVDRGDDILLRTCKDEIYVYEIVNERMHNLTRDLHNITDEEINKEFVRQIKYRMLLRSMMQSDLADICNVTQTAVSRYLSKDNIPNVFVASKIAKALECGLDEMIFEPSNYFNIR